MEQDEGLTNYGAIGRKPTSATSEEGRINVAKGGMPWHGEPTETSTKDHFKYSTPSFILL